MRRPGMGRKCRRRDDWLMPLTPAEIAEVETATKAAGRARRPTSPPSRRAISRCPTLGPKLKARVRTRC